MYLYEPIDLEDMDTRAALAAVSLDIDDHDVLPDGNGLFTATRHLDLLCHLAARMAADAEYRLSPESAGNEHGTAPVGEPSAEAQGQAAGHLGRAIYHHTQTIAPLVELTRLSAPNAASRWAMKADLYGRVCAYRQEASRSLDAAHACLDVPRHRPQDANETAAVPAVAKDPTATQAPRRSR